MRVLVLIFLLMALYGGVTGHFGAALLALAVAGFTHWAEKKFKQQEAEYLASPASAKPEKDTVDMLDEQGTEAARRSF